VGAPLRPSLSMTPRPFTRAGLGPARDGSCLTGVATAQGDAEDHSALKAHLAGSPG
jgi:hypothetical protein